MIILILGAVAIFIWSKLSPTMPTEKTEILEMPEPPRGKDVLDTLKDGAKKIAAIVGGGGAAAIAATALPAAAAVPAGLSAIAPTTLASAAFIPAAVAVVPLTALPAATILPAGLSAMAPTTLASATYGVTPAVVGSGTGSSSIGAGVGGSSGVGAAIGGAAMVVAPLVVVPLLAKWLDKIFGHGFEYSEEQKAQMDEWSAWKKDMATYESSPTWNPKTGFVEDPDNPQAFPGGS